MYSNRENINPNLPRPTFTTRGLKQSEQDRLTQDKVIRQLLKKKKEIDKILIPVLRPIDSVEDTEVLRELKMDEIQSALAFGKVLLEKKTTYMLSARLTDSSTYLKEKYELSQDHGVNYNR